MPPVDADRVAEFVKQVATKRVVVEFGFPVAWLGVAVELKRQGASLWWFDGDDQGCLASWREEWRGIQPDDNWRRQVANVAAHWTQIEAIFTPNVLATRLADGHLSCEEIDAKVLR